MAERSQRKSSIPSTTRFESSEKSPDPLIIGNGVVCTGDISRPRCQDGVKTTGGVNIDMLPDSNVEVVKSVEGDYPTDALQSRFT